MVRDDDTLMELATKSRRKAKRTFKKAFLVSMSKGSGKPNVDWDKYAKLQEDLLCAEMEVLRLAASGIRISDFGIRCKNSSKVRSGHDITFEFENLFTTFAGHPTSSMREYLKGTAKPENRTWARDKILEMMNPLLRTFLEAADLLTKELLRSMLDIGRPDPRIRLGLIRSIMYIGDYFRYSFDDQKSKNAAQLMHIMSPSDPEAHMRLGLTLGVLVDTKDAIRPFFHYCVFLANRKVSVSHRESDVVRNFVMSVPMGPCPRLESDGNTSRRDFFCAYIHTLWSVLSEPCAVASEKVHNNRLWRTFSKSLEEGLSEEDMLHLVGCLIFTHYRTSPKGAPNGALLPERFLSDFLVGEVIRLVCEDIEAKMKGMRAKLRSLKRNRRRTFQKKRKHCAMNAKIDPGISLGTTVFKPHFRDLEITVPTLGPISFLAHYWSKARFAPQPTADLQPLAGALQAVKSLEEEMKYVEGFTKTVRVLSHIDSKILDEFPGKFPAMIEDVKYCTMQPCRDHKMFNHASLQDVPLLSFFQNHDNQTVRRSLENIGRQSYESLVLETAKRHLEAFSIQCINEMSDMADSIDNSSRSALVCWAIRKHRLKRLLLDLETKPAGGRLAEMTFSQARSEGVSPPLSDEYRNLSLPPAAQPCSEQHGGSLHEVLSTSQLGARVEKRQRVAGSFTLHGASPSLSSGDAARPSAEALIPQPSPDVHGPSVLAQSVPRRVETREEDEELLVDVNGPVEDDTGVQILSQGSRRISFTPTARREREAAPKPVKTREEIIQENMLEWLYSKKRCRFDLDRTAAWRMEPSGPATRVVFYRHGTSSSSG